MTRAGGLDALCMAANGLLRACLDRLPLDLHLIRDPSTALHLPAAPDDFDELLARIDAADKASRAQRQ